MTRAPHPVQPLDLLETRPKEQIQLHTAGERGMVKAVGFEGLGTSWVQAIG
jgi:hypothetical protein